MVTIINTNGPFLIQCVNYNDGDVDDGGNGAEDDVQGGTP